MLNLSIRSKATWDKSFLMLLAYCKQIIQNQRKTVRRAVTINVCWRKSSCELFPLATTHTKVANSGSGKMGIAHYRICYFFQKRVALPLTKKSGAPADGAPADGAPAEKEWRSRWKSGAPARYFSSSLLPSSGGKMSVFCWNANCDLTIKLPKVWHVIENYLVTLRDSLSHLSARAASWLATINAKQICWQFISSPLAPPQTMKQLYARYGQTVTFCYPIRIFENSV